MLRFRILAGLACVSVALGAPPLAAAQTPATQAAVSPAPPSADVQQLRAELDRLKKEFDAVRQLYGDRLLALEQQIGRLTEGPSTTSAAETPSTQAAGQAPQTPQPPQTPQEPPATATPAGSSKVFNPDTSVIGNFVGVAGKNPYSTQRPLELTEAEVAFQAIVDPYAKADFFLSATPEGLDVEEGYVTFTSLPANLLLKVGKMRAQFGKVNTLHTHAMPTVDRPLVTENLVGGEEGISDSGMSLSHLIDNPVLFLEATGEVYAGNSAVFQSDERSKLNYVGRLRAYRDISEDKNIDVGGSVAFGPGQVRALLEPVDIPDKQPVTLNKRLIGVDATFRYRPLRRAIYRRLNLRTELIWSTQDRPDTSATTSFGFYGLGEYQFARRWYLGARFDRSARVMDSHANDTGGSFFVTFWPTEFSQIRTQYRFTSYAEGKNANEFLFQFNFAIGAHGAHLF